MWNKLEQYIIGIRYNRWYRYFAIFCRICLAVAFAISGWVKISGERFAAGLPSNHPLGHYFDALLDTGFYYTFIGIGQVIVAILLLIPRTALLGAIASFPIMINIFVLTYSVRFEGTRIVTFMLLANLFLLVWDFQRLKPILAFQQRKNDQQTNPNYSSTHSFPYVFFTCVLLTLATVIGVNQIMYDIRPGNSPEECWNGCRDSTTPKASKEFCDCIYTQGHNLRTCLDEFEKAKAIELGADRKSLP
ncbi:DoxX family protein [Aquirufa ecclesiirivi]|uniref:DoxX family protein n=1 Tax=Aquirufa ecclesiirivi TaxID=2715124 RepID=UPI0022A80C24|nr:DoxX family protein [Aquirufa ecclesiirivi]